MNVRAAIAKIGGTFPENIPPAEPIKNIEKRLKNKKPSLDFIQHLRILKKCIKKCAVEFVYAGVLVFPCALFDSKTNDTYSLAQAQEWHYSAVIRNWADTCISC